MVDLIVSSSTGARPDREAIISRDAESRLQDRSRRALKAIRIHKSQYMNNRIEQDHRRIKRQVRPMLGFRSFSSAAVTLAGIEMVHMMRKRRGRFAFNPVPSLQWGYSFALNKIPKHPGLPSRAIFVFLGFELEPVA